MAKTNYQTIDEYHESFSGEILDRMQSIRKIIHQEVPNVEECISYQIPCFKYKGYLIYYAAFPKHISLSYPYSEAFWGYFKPNIKDYKTSKAVIQFPISKALPLKLIKQIIAYRKKENDKKVK